MPKLSFNFIKEDDLFNLWESCNIDPLWKNDKKPLRQKFIDKWRGRTFNDCKLEIESHLELLYNSNYIDIFSKSINEGWNKINNSFFEKLSNVTKKPIYTQSFSANLTTSGRCYSNKETDSFMLSIRRPYLHALRTCGHEIFHLQFEHYYWADVAKRIGNRNTNLFSESLTVLLNCEFRDLLIAEDMGYEEHKNFRKYIEDIWTVNKDFNNLIDKGVEYIQIRQNVIC